MKVELMEAALEDAGKDDEWRSRSSLTSQRRAPSWAGFEPAGTRPRDGLRVPSRASRRLAQRGSATRDRRDELSRIGLRRAEAAEGSTPAQARVAELVAAGLTNLQIAGQLHMSLRAVESLGHAGSRSSARKRHAVVDPAGESMTVRPIDISSVPQCNRGRSNYPLMRRRCHQRARDALGKNIPIGPAPPTGAAAVGESAGGALMQGRHHPADTRRIDEKSSHRHCRNISVDYRRGCRRRKTAAEAGYVGSGSIRRQPGGFPRSDSRGPVGRAEFRRSVDLADLAGASGGLDSNALVRWAVIANGHQTMTDGTMPTSVAPPTGSPPQPSAQSQAAMYGDPCENTHTDYPGGNAARDTFSDARVAYAWVNSTDITDDWCFDYKAVTSVTFLGLSPLDRRRCLHYQREPHERPRWRLGRRRRYVAHDLGTWRSLDYGRLRPSEELVCADPVRPRGPASRG